MCPLSFSRNKLFLTNLSVNVNIPLVGKMRMSQRFLKKVILLYLLNVKKDKYPFYRPFCRPRNYADIECDNEAEPLVTSHAPVIYF
jgi:hypothetical protein